MELTELPEPVGNLILDSGIKGINLSDGTYYHYSDVISFMKEYADKELATVKAERDRLREFIKKEYPSTGG